MAFHDGYDWMAFSLLLFNITVAIFGAGFHFEKNITFMSIESARSYIYVISYMWICFCG